IKVTGQYLSPLNTPAASSSWEIRCANNETIVFATSVTSGQVNAAWIGSCILQPETSYIIRVQATDSAGRSSQPAEAAITTVPRSQTEDTDGNGIPDQQEPAGEDLSHYGYNPDLPLPQDTKIISFHDKAVLLESPDGYPVTYFSGMEAENLPDFLRAPYGVFLSRVEVPEGQTVRLRFIFPEVLPGGSRWYKYDESAAATQRWQEYSQVEMTGNVAIVTLTDGGSGDADGVANGVIVDPSGPVVRSADSGGCFIATAAFGSPLSKEIEVLRLFRDRVLCPTEVGRAFVTWYYRKGPAAASFISRKGWLRAIVRLMLYPVVWLAALFLKGLLPYLMVGFWLLTILRSKYRRLTKSTR
ncbi:MAG TPA: hypothetical protein PK644_08850, partial [bacterium]|nr:hypothetical protein [bacterium]